MSRRGKLPDEGTQVRFIPKESWRGSKYKQVTGSAMVVQWMINGVIGASKGSYPLSTVCFSVFLFFVPFRHTAWTDYQARIV